MPEIENFKKARIRCKYLDKTGCTIYDTRPANCENYECIWIKGLGTQDDNPKLSGVLIDRRNSNLNPPTIYIASEVWKDAFTSETGIATLDRMSKELNSKIILTNFERDKVLRTHRADGVI